MKNRHPIGQILNVDCKSEFHDRGNDHPHAAIHVFDAPKIVITYFINEYITCPIPNESMYPDLNKLAKPVQTDQHRKICEKTKSARCRFKAPWPPSDIVCGGGGSPLPVGENLDPPSIFSPLGLQKLSSSLRRLPSFRSQLIVKSD